MNFFEHQDQARRNTRWLVLLFVLAVVCLIIIINFFLLLFPWEINSRAFSSQGSNHALVCLMQPGCDFWAQVDWVRMGWISLAVVLTIGGVSLYKWLSISAGGKTIATMMGGQMIKANTTDADEKRLLNVVEEMALAANMPVPAVYVLPHEFGINAFAAGFSSRDAVVAVTQGTLQSFNREQLQGVIAHEFSHILNGDMRLNMYLIAVLYGIVFITEAGYALLRGGAHSRRDSKSGPVMLLAIGLVIIGWIGTFFASLIKAAVSRQREFLADASAVQFTRNPGGIADALKVIGGSSSGSHISNAHGHEISHLFFGQAMGWGLALFATHPPLEERIRRIQPQWDGQFIAPSFRVKQNKGAAVPPAFTQQEKLGVLVSAVMAADADESVTAKPQDSLHEPLGAAAALCHLLLPPALSPRRDQLEAIRAEWPELYQVMENSPWQHSSRADFLPIVELAVSGLRLFSEADYLRLKQWLIRLIKADGRIDLYEWSLYYLLRASVDSHFGHNMHSKPRHKDATSVREEMVTVLAVLIDATSQNSEQKRRAFSRACNTCGIYSAPQALPNADMSAFTLAIRKLADAVPMLKSRFIKAMVDAAQVDGEIETVEKNTIIAIAAAIDTPVSDVLLRQLHGK